MQTSEVTSIGVCLQNETLEMVDVVPVNTELLFICGTLTGATKKSFSARLSYGDRGVFYRSGNWKPGNFFVPLKSTELSWINAKTFQPGEYRAGVAYGRAVLFERKFKVATR